MEKITENATGNATGEGNGDAAAAPPVAQRIEPPAPAAAQEPPTAAVVQESPAAAAPPPALQPLGNCPACGSPRKPGLEFCEDCGWMFAMPAPAADSNGGGAPGVHVPPQLPVKERYQIGSLLAERQGVYRYQGLDLKHESGKPTPVIILASAVVPTVEPVTIEPEPVPAAAEVTEVVEDFLPSFDEPLPVAEISTEGAAWPSVSWEKNVLTQTNHPTFPKVLDHFIDGDFEYLVEEAPQGTVLWDAWDDPDNDASVRWGWLIQLAEGLRNLHSAGAMIEAIRPDIIVITPEGQPMFANLLDLLPIPLPEGAPIRGTLYTAPELIVSPQTADARADLYSFGAMIYSLEYLHHPLEERDFEKQFYPRMITDRYPDVHPGFNRLIIKTFVRDLNIRFPTEEAAKKDKTGFTELIETLEACKRNFERVRFDIAAWTTTGMVRTNNEDAFAFLHACESRIDDMHEYALLLLCDGMGGYEAGEVAAAMAIESMREFCLQQPMFGALIGKKPPTEELDVEECKKVLKEALRHANKTVYAASRKPGGKRGMGCTAEVVYIDDRNIVVGHVGDSRVYHLTNGTIRQMTRDQTLVNRLVELGMLTPEEAEHHDRKNELQQAIGGQPEVEPGIYSAPLRRGDWVLVCSDGLTNHIPNKDLEKMLTRETSGSADDACRRLLNLVNLRGATDNSTIILVRTS